MRQLHFHLGPGSTSFLRVHKPGKFGDNMDEVRFTIVDANQKQILTKGFETGRVYSGIRGVVPFYYNEPYTNNKIHIGALEAGTSFESIINNIQHTLHADAAIFLDIDHMRKYMWESAVEDKMLNNYGRSGYLSDSKITSDVFKYALFNLDGLKLRPDMIKIFKYKDKTYYMAAKGFNDYVTERDEGSEHVGLFCIYY